MQNRTDEVTSVTAKCGVALSSCSAGFAFIEQNHIIITVIMALIGLLITIASSIIRWQYHRREDVRLKKEHEARMRNIFGKHDQPA
jgi:energy-converting hydrogenase Eha subunit G